MRRTGRGAARQQDTPAPMATSLVVAGCAHWPQQAPAGRISSTFASVLRPRRHPVFAKDILLSRRCGGLLRPRRVSAP